MSYPLLSRNLSREYVSVRSVSLLLQRQKTASNYCKLESDEERTFKASFREKLFSQKLQGNGLTAR
jgi:hypothetical protein